MSNVENIAKNAKAAFEASQIFSSEERIKALYAIKEELEKLKTEILNANKKDLEVLFIF